MAIKNITASRWPLLANRFFHSLFDQMHRCLYVLTCIDINTNHVKVRIHYLLIFDKDYLSVLR